MRKGSTKYVVLLILWSIPILFHVFFEDILDSVLVIPFVSRFEASLFADLIFFGCFAYALWLFFYSKWIRVYLDWDGILYVALFTSYAYLYKYGWFGFNHWNYTSLTLLPWVKYIDLIISFPVLLFLYKVVPPYGIKGEELDPNFALLDDSNIEGTEEDELNRKDLAEFVAKHIHNTNSNQSFAIGINAKWGDGKTSFQKMIGEYLVGNDRHVVVLSFNPWKSLDEKKIIQDFFEVYSDKIREYNFRLGQKILVYGRQLLDVNGNWWTSLINSLLVKRRNQESQFEEIDRLLLKVNRKIVVFIDDLDRLSTREILEVVKLIRNSANFRNTFFVVG